MSEPALHDILSKMQLRALLEAGYVVLRAADVAAEGIGCAALAEGAAARAALRRAVSLDDCVDAVAEISKVGRKALLSEVRRREVAWPRQAAMALGVKLAGLSLPVVGAKFHRDHTTVLYAVRAVQERLEAGDEETREIYEGAAATAPLIAAERLGRIAKAPIWSARHG